MKKLILLRHSEAEAQPIDKDAHRPLTSRGLEQAFQAGSFLKEINKIPDFILTSNALRTIQTMEQVSKGIGKEIQTESNPMLFRCTTEDLSEHVRAFRDTYQTALIINHNPVIHQFAMELTQTNLNLSNRDDFNKIESNYPPSTLTVIDCDIKTWEEFDSVFCTLLRTKLFL